MDGDGDLVVLLIHFVLEKITSLNGDVFIISHLCQAKRGGIILEEKMIEMKMLV